MKDYYRILGIEPSASAAVVKAAYRKQAFALHPDRNPSEEAHAAFQAVQEAYDVLGVDAKRRDYDENRRRSLIEHPLETAREIWSAYLKGVLA
jgi:curved DNA-binding protein CbpA